MDNQKIENMLKAGKIIALILDKLKTIIKPNTSLIEIDKWVASFMKKHNVKPSFLNYNGFPNVICASVNDKIVHAIPNNYFLKEGDIITIDVGCSFNGYHCDAAKTYGVGSISKQKEKLLKITKQALNEALKVVKDNVSVGDIGFAICDFVYKNKMSIPEEFSGHGIGKNLHEKPHIFNIGKPNLGKKLKSGMTIAIEPIVHLGGKEIIIESDRWTARTKDGSDAAHFEHTILITKKGYKILTSLNQKEIING